MRASGFAVFDLDEIETFGQTDSHIQEFIPDPFAVVAKVPLGES